MQTVATAVHAALAPAILVLGALLIGLLAALVLIRVARRLAARRHASWRERSQPYVDAWLQPGADDATLERLASFCRTRHARAAAVDLMLALLRSMTGDISKRISRALDRLGLCDEWLEAAGDRRWWVSSTAVQALGLVRDRRALPRLVTCLHAAHPEVRAAALDALGHLADPSTLPVLVRQLASTRHERVRVIAALSAFGPDATGALVDWARDAPDQRLTIARALGEMGNAGGLAPLVDWLDDASPALRAAALNAIGDIGPDERAFYFALRALRDEDAGVRAMAARALGRSRRPDAAPYLAASLGDEWAVASQSAGALKQLGDAGLAQLVASANRNAAGADLARQMLWELHV